MRVRRDAVWSHDTRSRRLCSKPSLCPLSPLVSYLGPDAVHRRGLAIGPIGTISPCDQLLVAPVYEAPPQSLVLQACQTGEPMLVSSSRRTADDASCRSLPA